MADGSTPTTQAGIDLPYLIGLNLKEIIEQLARELLNARSDIDAADSLNNVAGMALRHMDCDGDGDVADVLQNHVYPSLVAARDRVATAEEIIERLKEVCHA